MDLRTTAFYGPWGNFHFSAVLRIAAGAPVVTSGKPWEYRTVTRDHDIDHLTDSTILMVEL